MKQGKSKGKGQISKVKRAEDDFSAYEKQKKKCRPFAF